MLITSLINSWLISLFKNTAELHISVSLVSVSVSREQSAQLSLKPCSCFMHLLHHFMDCRCISYKVIFYMESQKPYPYTRLTMRWLILWMLTVYQHSAWSNNKWGVQLLNCLDGKQLKHVSMYKVWSPTKTWKTSVLTLQEVPGGPCQVLLHRRSVWSNTLGHRQCWSPQNCAQSHPSM